MEQNNSEKNIDITKMTDEEIIDFYAKISENVMILDYLLDKNEKEEVVKEYQKIKNKI